MKEKEEQRLINLKQYECELRSKGYKYICGIDEAGRGPLAGPVVVASVIMPENSMIEGVNDSKKVSEKKREKLYDLILSEAISYGVGIIGQDEIDEINILEASKEAMKIALSNLSKKPEHVLIDAVKLDIDIPSTSIIKGDAKSLSIAAASVIAKVTRDRMMYDLDKIYPEYGYASHKGYPTKKHIEAVKKYGVKDFYRFTFSPISEIIKEYKN